MRILTFLPVLLIIHRIIFLLMAGCNASCYGMSLMHSKTQWWWLSNNKITRKMLDSKLGFYSRDIRLTMKLKAVRVRNQPLPMTPKWLTHWWFKLNKYGSKTPFSMTDTKCTYLTRIRSLMGSSAAQYSKCAILVRDCVQQVKHTVNLFLLS